MTAHKSTNYLHVLVTLLQLHNISGHTFFIVLCLDNSSQISNLSHHFTLLDLDRFLREIAFPNAVCYVYLGPCGSFQRAFFHYLDIRLQNNVHK